MAIYFETEDDARVLALSMRDLDAPPGETTGSGRRELLYAQSDLLVAIVDYTNGLARLEAAVAGPL